MTTVLITGAAGFVGRNMVEAVLEETDWGVVALDRNPQPIGYPNGSRVEYVQLWAGRGEGEDLRRVSLRLADMDIDYIVNLAAPAQPATCSVDPAGWARDAAGEAAWVMRQADHLGVQRVLHVSTVEVFGPVGPAGNPADPYDAYRPGSAYAAGKAAQDQIILGLGRELGVPVVLSHTANLFGPYQPSSKFLPTVIRKVMDGQSVGIVPGVRAPLYVRDACSAWIRLVCMPPPEVELKDELRAPVAGLLAMSNTEFAARVVSAYHDNADVTDDRPWSVAQLPAPRAGATDTYLMRSSDLMLGVDYGGYKPDLNAGIRDTVQWYLDDPERLEP